MKKKYLVPFSILFLCVVNHPALCLSNFFPKVENNEEKVTTFNILLQLGEKKCKPYDLKELFFINGSRQIFSWFWIQIWMIQSWYSDMTCTFFSLWFGSRYLWLQELIFIERGKLEIRIDHRTVSISCRNFYITHLF